MNNPMHLLADNPALADQIAAEFVADYAAAGMPLSHLEGQFVGLKCDTPACGWEDMTIRFEEYEANVNRPCPNCGASILTPEDFATARGFNVLMERIKNRLPKDDGEGATTHSLRIQSDTKGSFILHEDEFEEKVPVEKQVLKPDCQEK